MCGCCVGSGAGRGRSRIGPSQRAPLPASNLPHCLIGLILKSLIGLWSLYILWLLYILYIHTLYFRDHNVQIVQYRLCTDSAQPRTRAGLACDYGSMIGSAFRFQIISRISSHHSVVSQTLRTLSSCTVNLQP